MKRSLLSIGLFLAVVVGFLAIPFGAHAAPPDTDDLIIRNSSGQLLLFPFRNSTFYTAGAGTQVGNGFAGVTHYLVGNWTGGSPNDLIVRKSDGTLLLFPFRNGSFYTASAGTQVGNGFTSITHFLVGDWTGDGTSDLIVRKTDGRLLLFPFRNNTFYISGTGTQVGNGFADISDYLVGNWTGDGTSDLIVRKNDGTLLLFPFRNNTFYTAGAGTQVGNGFADISDYLVGNWTGDGTSDLIVRKTDGRLLLFPFRNNTFYISGTGTQVGTGFTGVTNYLVGNWTGDGTSDLIVRKSDGKLLLFPFRNNTFYINGTGTQVGNGFTGVTNYLPANWVTP